MALLFIEGFDQYGTDNELFRGGWSSVALATVLNRLTGTDTRFNSGQCIELAANGIYIYRGFKPSVDVTVGMAVNFADAMATSHFLRLRNGGTDHLILQTTGAGEIQLIRGPSTSLGITSGLGLSAGQWYYIEINCRIDDSAGDFDVHLDGAQILQGTSQDTRNGGSAVIDNIELSGSSTVDTRFDDIYVLDDTGSDNVGLLGDCRVETVFPDALGNENDFTASPAVGQHLNVDDGLVPDHDTTYNHSATATDRELYGFAALTGGVDTVFGVAAKMICRKEDAGFREVRVISRSNVTEVESASKTLGVSYGIIEHIFENDPDGGGNWDEAAVNAAQFGLDLHT